MEVLVFGGTTEGRQLAEWLSERDTCTVTYCTATDYGASLVTDKKNVAALRGPLSQEQKAQLMTAHEFACIVDATHPYAQRISASIDELAQAYGKDVVRVARANSDLAPEKEAPHPNDMVESDGEGPVTREAVPRGSVPPASPTVVATVGEAARLVAAASGNVLLTTGTKDLAVFVEAMPDYRDRLYVRILPVEESFAKVRELGIPASHIVAMQGPFSTEFNCALIRELDIGTLVTKQSGKAGGFTQKAEAAQACGIELVVIERPHINGGVSLEEAQRLLEDRYGL